MFCFADCYILNVGVCVSFGQRLAAWRETALIDCWNASDQIELKQPVILRNEWPQNEELLSQLILRNPQILAVDHVSNVEIVYTDPLQLYCSLRDLNHSALRWKRLNVIKLTDDEVRRSGLDSPH